MPQQRSLVILFFAIVLGLAAVFLVNAFLTGKEEQQAAQKVTYAKVAVARVPLEFGTQITADNVRFVELPSNAIPVGSFASMQQVLPNGERRVALGNIAANEPILSNKISGGGGRASIAEILKPDMRAVAIRISDVAGVAGLVLPGDTVDVLISRTVPGPMGDASFNDVLLQNARVLAMDQNVNQDSDKPTVTKTATLEVNQIDAQKLALAGEVGTLSLVLRNVTDQLSPVVKTVSTEDLRDLAYGGTFRSPGPQYGPATMAWGAKRGSGDANSNTQRIVFSTEGAGGLGRAAAGAMRAPVIPAGASNIPSGSPLSRPSSGQQLLPYRGGNRTNVEIVRGTSGSSYEVERNGY